MTLQQPMQLPVPQCTPLRLHTQGADVFHRATASCTAITSDGAMACKQVHFLTVHAVMLKGMFHYNPPLLQQCLKFRTPKIASVFQKCQAQCCLLKKVIAQTDAN